MTRKINTGAGDVETISTVVTSTSSLSGATFQLSLGSYTTPGAWVSPSAVVLSSDNLTATLSLVIGASATNPPTGVYWLWRQIVGGPVTIDPPVTRYEITSSGGVATALITVGEVA